MKNITLIITIMIFSLFSKTQKKNIIYSTTKGVNYNHPEIEFTLSNNSIPKQDINTLIEYFEEEIKNGVKFQNDETIQIGCVTLKVKEKNSNTLEVHEPDFKSFPIKFINTLDNTLLSIRNQKDVIESINKPLDLDFINILQPIYVHKNYIKATDVFFDKYLDDQNVSGLVVYDYEDQDGNNNKDNFKNISVYEFWLNRPDLIKYIAIPPDCQILQTPYVISSFSNHKDLGIKKGSYLDKLNVQLKKT